MGLHPLEFSECYLDSPVFREKIKSHEAELDKTNRFIKELYKDGKNLINATKQLVLAQRKFAQSLGEFQFEYIGDAKTDDERCIDESLQEFSNFLKNLEDQRELMMRNITETLMKPLEKFRKEQLGSAKAERKKYEKETEKYYSSLEKLLNMSAKKKEPQLQEADSQVETIRQHFQEESLDYVCKLQEIQERKKFDCVEPMLAFFQTVFTFYHQGFELANDFNHYKKALQINIQNTRSRFEGTRVEVFELMKRIREVPQEYKQTSPISSEGYLYVQEKRPPPFGSSWVKRYCTFVKEQKILHMVTFDHRSGGKMGETESVTLKSCVRKTTDMLDRRFCLDIEITDRPGTVLTVQSLSEDDHKFWIHAMGGKEPAGQYLGKTYSKERGSINDQGLYRVVGVSSKVQKLLSLMIDEKSNDVDLSTCEEWDVKTITSTLKLYLRSLPEPLMTYGLYKDFIAPAKGGSPESRSQAIHCLVHKLPEKNRLVLGLLLKHLATVAAHSKLNLMTVANLGVVFGPTLMRPQEDTVAAIMDLKFQNIVVEILIEQHEKIFGDVPGPSSPGLSAPTRQSKKLSVRQNRPLAVYNPKKVDLQTVSPTSPDVGSNSDEASLGSNESVSSQSTASGTPPEKANHGRLLASLSTGDSPGACIAVAASRLNSGALTKASSDGDKTVDGVTGGGGKRAMAVYPCEAEHESELSFQVGAIFRAVVPSREPGWLEGELEGKKGLIPENYVEML
uniref:Rho GTPase-activating protein 10 n=1 Tax=Oncorhynchus tshawytscha TaxID=74940 RepID=A0A8C8FAS8_ONCTS